MSDMLRDAQRLQAERAAQEAELSRQQREERVARAAARVALEEGVLAAVNDFRDVMIAKGVRPQPLHASSEYSIGRSLGWRDLKHLKYFDEIDTGLRGWRPLGIRSYESENSGYVHYGIGGPFVTTDGLVVPVGEGTLPLIKAAADPADCRVTNLPWRRDRPARPPAWVLGREPFPIEQIQTEYFDFGGLTVDGVRQTLTESMAHWLDIAKERQ